MTGESYAKKLGIAKYDPYDPEQNKRIGSAVLKDYLGKFAGNIELGLASFNWGPGNVLKALKLAAEKGLPRTWESIEKMAPAETRKYVAKVTKSYAA